MAVTYTNMYRKLKEFSLQSGVCTYEDFGMEAPVAEETTV
jgi:hypothetical protein